MVISRLFLPTFVRKITCCCRRVGRGRATTIAVFMHEASKRPCFTFTRSILHIWHSRVKLPLRCPAFVAHVVEVFFIAITFVLHMLSPQSPRLPHATPPPRRFLTTSPTSHYWLARALALCRPSNCNSSRRLVHAHPSYTSPYHVHFSLQAPLWALGAARWPSSPSARGWNCS
jgi:hypothetical protein